MVAQGELPNGRVSRFRKPGDPKQLWIEEALGVFHYPRAVAVLPSILPNGGYVFIGEDNVAAFPYRDGYLLVTHTRVVYRPLK